MADNYKKNRKIISLIFNPKKPDHVKALTFIANNCRGNKGYTDFIVEFINQYSDKLLDYKTLEASTSIPVAPVTILEEKPPVIEKKTTPSDDIEIITAVNNNIESETPEISTANESDDDETNELMMKNLDALYSAAASFRHNDK